MGLMAIYHGLRAEKNTKLIIPMGPIHPSSLGGFPHNSSVEGPNIGISRSARPRWWIGGLGVGCSHGMSFRVYLPIDEWLIYVIYVDLCDLC